jgi:AraC-like DNA-binding protein
MARVDRRNTTQYWWARHVPGLSLLRAEFTSHDYPPHSHDALVVVTTEAGGCSGLKSRGVVEEVQPSKLLVFNPAEPHSSWMGWSRQWCYRSFYLTQSSLDDLADGLGVRQTPYFTQNAFNDPDLIREFNALHRQIERDGERFQEREKLVQTFGRLFRRHGSDGRRIAPAPRDRSVLGQAVALIRERHAENLQLEELAGAVGLTSFQLIDLFKRNVGLTPHAYLTQVRLGAACRHLRNGLPPAEVATEAGFYDQSAMNNRFKRCYGITPLQFAKAARA